MDGYQADIAKKADNRENDDTGENDPAVHIVVVWVALHAVKYTELTIIRERRLIGGSTHPQSRQEYEASMTRKPNREKVLKKWSLLSAAAAHKHCSRLNLNRLLEYSE